MVIIPELKILPKTVSAVPPPKLMAVMTRWIQMSGDKHACPVFPEDKAKNSEVQRG